MTDKEKQNKLRIIKEALKVFPEIVKQNARRGKAHQKLMKAFEPMAKDLARRVARRKASTYSRLARARGLAPASPRKARRLS